MVHNSQRYGYSTLVNSITVSKLLELFEIPKSEANYNFFYKRFGVERNIDYIVFENNNIKAVHTDYKEKNYASYKELKTSLFRIRRRVIMLIQAWERFDAQNSDKITAEKVESLLNQKRR